MPGCIARTNIGTKVRDSGRLNRGIIDWGEEVPGTAQALRCLEGVHAEKLAFGSGQDLETPRSGRPAEPRCGRTKGRPWGLGRQVLQPRWQDRWR
jgi:hypothetical protein